jgi:DNA-binding NarL/FixJ family response regulator
MKRAPHNHKNGVSRSFSRLPETVEQTAIDIMIIDHRRFFHELLRLLFDRKKRIQIVSEATTTQQALSLLASIKPKIALINMAMPGVDKEFIITIRRLAPAMAVLIFNASVDEHFICQAIRAGARGCISNDASVSDIIAAIEAIHRGEFWLESKIVARFIEEQTILTSHAESKDEVSHEELTSREKDVLRCLKTGCTNKEIAEKLFISEKTVKTHLNTIFRKLNVTKRLQAILLAINRGLG